MDEDAKRRAFDPYHKWLGIPPEERPPHHYRLLGIGTFEADLEVIEGAADRQMAHLRTFATGAHSAESQRLLNEVSAAKVCLLNSTRKDAYDADLRVRMAPRQPASPAPQPVPMPVPHLAPVVPAAVSPVAAPVRWTQRAVAAVDAPAEALPFNHAPAIATHRNATAGRRGAGRLYRRRRLTGWTLAWVVLVVGAGCAAYLVVSQRTQLRSDVAKRPAKRSPPSSGGRDKNARGLADGKAQAESRKTREATTELGKGSPAARVTGTRQARATRQTQAAASPPNSTNGLRIHEARWGSGQTWVDVTPEVQAGIRDGRYLATAVLSALGDKDPLFGHVKNLVIRYSIGDRTRTETFGEGQLVYLAADHPSPVEGSELTLLEAKFGRGNGWVDVLDHLKPLVRGNSLSVKANSVANAGPAAGYPNVLFVRYALNGRTAHVAVTDRETLRIDGGQ